MFEYALDVHEEPGSVWLTCAAIPEMHAVGDTPGEALATTIDAIETAFSIYVDDRRLIPTAHTGEQENDVVLGLPCTDCRESCALEFAIGVRCQQSRTGASS